MSAPADDDEEVLLDDAVGALELDDFDDEADAYFDIGDGDEYGDVDAYDDNEGGY